MSTDVMLDDGKMGLPRRKGGICVTGSVVSFETSRPLLNVSDVTVRFGGIVALQDVSFEVPEASICGLIGPNGAGKTTLFNCLSRLYSCQKGKIDFRGETINNLPIHRIAQLGIGRTFQNLAIFRSLTVEQNVMIGMHCQTSSGFWAGALGVKSAKREEAFVKDKAHELISYLDLDRYSHRIAGDLPFGIQKRIEFARALASGPKLLLLDEPAAGLNHEELKDLSRLITDVRDKLNITVLLVEHHMGLVMSISDRIVVLNFGRKIAEGGPSSIQSNPEVIRAYLGGAKE